jgi:hypothetical protein
MPAIPRIFWPSDAMISCLPASAPANVLMRQRNPAARTICRCDGAGEVYARDEAGFAEGVSQGSRPTVPSPSCYYVGMRVGLGLVPTWRSPR